MDGHSADSTNDVRIPDLLKAVQQLDSTLSLSQRMQSRAISSSFGLIDYVPGREIRYLIRLQGDEESVSVWLPQRDQSLSLTCSCNENSRQKLCHHKTLILTAMSTELRNPESNLSLLLRYGSVDAVNRHTAFKLLKSYRSMPITRPVRIVDAGEDSPETPDVRYCWNLSLGLDSSRHQSLLMRPASQKILRSGEWGKPREISLKTFGAVDEDEMSATDLQMFEHTRRGQMHIDTVGTLNQMLDIMTGSDQFMVELEPCLLEKGTIELHVMEEGESYLITASPAVLEMEMSAKRCEVVSRMQSSLIIVWNRSEGVARWYSCRQKEVRFINHVLTNRLVVPKSEWPAMLAELMPISADLPIRFPPSVNILLRDVKPSFVLLLRLKRGSFLHAVICVRDLDSALIRPGDGQLIRIVKEDHQDVQYVRNAIAEQKLAKELAGEFLQPSEVVDGLHTWKISSEADVVGFLEKAAELTQAERLTVIWHKGSSSKLNVIGRVTAGNVRVQIERQRDWFGLNGTCTVGNQTFTLQQLLESMQNQSAFGMVELTPGQWVSIAEELKKAVRDLADSAVETRGKLRIDATAALNLNDLDSVGFQFEADRHWQKCLERVRVLKDFDPELPDDLKCQLREYQREGFQWLCRLAEWGVGGILADDMGLGKTVQTLAVLLRRKEAGPALVIAPLSLGFNWVNETERFAPSLKPLLLRDADRGELLENASAGQVVICSYGLALREVNRLKEVKWASVVLDEAQNIKNSNSQTAKAVKTIPAEWKVALTGTPIENHLGELWSIFSVIAPGVLGPWDVFRNRFASPIEKDNNQERREALTRVISPFVLRRTKAGVLNDLPDRNEMNLLVDLSPEERAVYDRMRLAAVAELGSVEDTTSNAGEQRLRILQILTRLRQLACHVGLLDSEWKGSSSKLDLLMEKLTELKEGGHRALIFSQFTTHLGFIRKACEQNGFSYLYLDGQTPPKQRQKNVEAFQEGQADVFLISLKAGGTGLNLTAADYVIHMDPWWNPAVEDQATDRAHRIGQTKNVMVYRIISRGTIEEQILNVHDEKRDLVDSVLSGSDSSARLSTVELAELIRTGLQS